MSVRRVLALCVLGALASAVRASAVRASAVRAAAVRADDAMPPMFNVTVAAPNKCQGNDCKLFLMVMPMKNGNEWQWHVTMEAKAEQYVAMALAESAMMGNDSVIECVKSTNPNNPVDVFTSKNMGPPFQGRGHVRDQNQNIDNVAKNITSSYKDGRIQCSFILKQRPAFPKDSSVDLLSKNYFLQVASGDKVDANNIGYHSQWATTLRAVYLVEGKEGGKLRTVDNVAGNSGGNSGNSASTSTVSGLVLSLIFILKAWL